MAQVKTVGGIPLHTIVLVLAEWVQLETVGRDSIDQGNNSEQATTTGQSSLTLNYYCQSSLVFNYICAI